MQLYLEKTGKAIGAMQGLFDRCRPRSGMSAGSSMPTQMDDTYGYRGIAVGCRVVEMFVRRIAVMKLGEDGAEEPCPIRWIDNFAMRNFTNDVVFDDTLPVADGLLEAGLRVPLERLHDAMEDWFRRKGYLKPADRLAMKELAATEITRRSAAG